MKFELEDIALKYTDPEAYYNLVEQVSAKKSQRDEVIHTVIEEIKEGLADLNLHYEIMEAPSIITASIGKGRICRINRSMKSLI